MLRLSYIQALLRDGKKKELAEELRSRDSLSKHEIELIADHLDPEKKAKPGRRPDKEKMINQQHARMLYRIHRNINNMSKGDAIAKISQELSASEDAVNSWIFRR